MPIIAGVIPVASFAQTKRICELCDASIPAPLEAAFDGRRGRPEREFELGVAYAAQQCAELLIAGAPGIHFYALNRAPATRAVLGALRAVEALGAGRRGDAATLDRQRRLDCRSGMANRREEERERLRQKRVEEREKDALQLGAQTADRRLRGRPA